jgi:hypothetical protein
MLSVVDRHEMLGVNPVCHVIIDYAEYHYAECRHAECHGTFVLTIARNYHLVEAFASKRFANKSC